jgi:hypothetical protein
MSFEKSPSLDEYKTGLPENLPDPSLKKRRIRILLGVLFTISLFLGIANFLQSQTVSLLIGTGSVQGRVIDAQGAPFLGEIFVIGVNQIVRTSSDGSFFLNRIPAGSQSLVVANAETGHEHSVEIIAGQTVNMGQLQFLVTATPGQ